MKNRRIQEIEEQRKDELFVYKILLQRHINDDNLMGQRTSILVTTNSILFLGFVYLIDKVNEMYVYAIPILGLLWSISTCLLNWRCQKALRLWHDLENDIEENGKGFLYIKKMDWAPQIEFRKQTSPKWLLGPNLIFTFILPNLFVLLWIISLIWIVLD